MNLDRLAFLANNLILLNLFYTVATVAQWVIARRFGIVVKSIQIFVGKSSAAVRCYGTPVEFGWVPMGSTVTYDGDQFFTRPRAFRLIMVLGGPAALLVLAILLLGLGPAVQHYLSGFGQYVLGGVAFKAGLLARYHALWHQSIVAAISVLVAKSAAFATVNLAAHFFAHAFGSPGGRFWAALLTVHTLLLFFLMGVWLISACQFLTAP